MEDSSADEHVTSDTDLLTPLDRKTPDPSRDAPLRWLGLMAFLMINCAAVIALITLMIVKSN